MDTNTFLTTHPVFTTSDVENFLAHRGTELARTADWTRKRLLQYHQERGHIVAVRRGLYASVPAGQDPATYQVDTFLIAGNLTKDAVLAYHTALLMHGTAHSYREERVCLSEQSQVRPFAFRGVTYRAVKPPGALPPAERLTIGVEARDLQGLSVRVTSLERTLVDVLDRPKLVGGWEEAWRSLEDLDVYLDLELVVRYTLLLQNATTAAKVGYFLESCRDRLHVGDAILEELRRHSPKHPHVAIRDGAPPSERKGRRSSRFLREWNLVVPTLVGGVADKESTG